MYQKEYLIDRHRKRLGWIIEQSNRINGYDNTGRLVGYVCKTNNKTYSLPDRRVIGYGNLLSHLIMESN